jgi:hypothetical protein
MVNYKTVSQFSIESGFTEAAIRKLIERSIWKEREVWVRANGRILITVEGYHRWVETEAGLEQSQTPPYKYNSDTKACSVESGLKLSPQMPIF